METHPPRIGRFRIDGLLGRGAMGIVYKAHDPHIERAVAIKLVRADLLDGQSRAYYLSRFNNEARMVGRCAHPNIVAIHDLSEEEGNPFLVLEYVDGQDLGKLYQPGTKASIADLRRIGLKILDALSYAHRYGIIHRDIKPANILLAGNDIKVTDFGISRAMSSDATLSSVLVGTPCYMSPEQCIGSDVDARSDLFALGSLLYQLLTGQRAFDAPNYAATLHKVIHDRPAPIGAVRNDVPAAMIRAIERALSKNREERFRDAQEMADAIGSADDDASFAGFNLATVVTPRLPYRPELDSRLGPLPGPLLEAGSRTRADPREGWSLSGSPASMASIERRLAHHIGPIARYQLREVLGSAWSPDELCFRLAEFLPDEAARPGFVKEIAAVLMMDRDQVSAREGGHTPMIAASQVDPSVLDDKAVTDAERALAKVMGPIAPRLVRSVLPNVNDRDGLYAACAALIQQPNERRTFLALVKPSHSP